MHATTTNFKKKIQAVKKTKKTYFKLTLINIHHH